MIEQQDTLITTEDEDGLELDSLVSGIESLADKPVADQVLTLEQTHEVLREKLS